MYSINWLAVLVSFGAIATLSLGVSIIMRWPTKRPLTVTDALRLAFRRRGDQALDSARDSKEAHASQQNSVQASEEGAASNR